MYSTGFYLFAINEADHFRLDNLIEKDLPRSDALRLMARDLDEGPQHGQKTRAVFELADFHLSLNGWERAYGKMAQKDAAERKREAKKLIIRRQLERIIGLMFAHPFITPTFDEYAMFMAYSAGLRSADLSRQIGAVIATPSLEIVAMGANDCPRFGGGQYWPVYDGESFTYGDEPEGRDYTRGYDSNRREHRRIVDEIVDVFKFNDDEEGRADRQKAWTASTSPA